MRRLPSAKIVDRQGREINPLLWGDCVTMREGEAPCRGKSDQAHA